MKMKKWYLIIDVAKCENCNNCFLACKDEHVNNDWGKYAAPQPNHGQRWMNIHIRERGQYPFIDVAYLPNPCMHCDEAPCIEASHDGAVYKRPDGIVIIDPVKSKGQKQIVTACPYGAIWWNEEMQIPQKCTLCAHLLDEGWTKTRCVQACPTGALTLKKLEDTELQSFMDKEKVEYYLPEKSTKPHVLYKNLHRFTRCFIGGSVAIMVKGLEECAQGARVKLEDTTGNLIDECTTDTFGDFKFDNLPENGGKYIIQIEHPGYSTKKIEVILSKSTNVGVIHL